MSPLLKNGQTVAHICKTQDIGCSKSSLYNYIDQNYLSARNIDLPRRVRYPKKKTKRSSPKDTTIRKGRTYEDFEKYIQENPDISIIEMDTVEGKKGAIEKNHEFIRYIIPKGTSMDNLTQNDIDLMINHINSLTRPSLNNATPYDLAQIL